VSASEIRLFAAIEPKKPPAILILAMQLAGLYATGYVVWFAVVFPRLHNHSLMGVAMWATAESLLAFLCSLAILMSIHWAATRSMGFDGRRMALQTSRTAIWFAPAAILLFRLSPAAFGAALVLVISATGTLCSQWLELDPEQDSPTLNFRAEPLAIAFAIGMSVQAAAVAALLKYTFLAVSLLCSSAAALTMLRQRGQIYKPPKPANMPRILLTVTLAAGLTVIGLYPNVYIVSELKGDSLPGPRGSLRALVQRISERDPETKPNELITDLYQPGSASIEISDKVYQGVILWPEVKTTHVVLVTPPPSWITSPLTPTSATPFDIPFSGQYWMFKPPQRRPPPGSYFRRASPITLSFVTTDQKPMSMEALQKLDQSINLGCCRAIQIAITNADLYFGTLALELVLIDTKAPGQPAQSLGQRDVTSRPRPWRMDFHVPQLTEILDFPVLRSGRISKFDEIQVWFHRTSMRIDRSAKISIDRFILVP
jgi:hypothetical protein